jgi:RNA polymerase sigma-70 factor (TIGR02960 family)
MGEAMRGCDAMTTTERLLDRARAGDGEAFRELTDPYRRELHVHCYRMLGTVQDAEDMLQETLLAAWRGLEGFEGRASLRAWLYRIATNRCLNALRGGRPRDLTPDAPGVPLPEPTGWGDAGWFEPYPDALLGGLADLTPGPEARYETRESISLAFIAAMQSLPPRQRVALLLRDVLGFRAAEAAGMLGTTEDAVTGALKRARSALAARLPEGGRDQASLPGTRHEREVAARFAAAFERGDVAAVIALLSDDARLTMPPLPMEYRGHAALEHLLTTIVFRDGRRYRLVPTMANGQPAFGAYLYDAHAPIGHAHGLVVLTVTRDHQISDVTRFLDTGVFAHFGLPRTLRGPHPERGPG